MLKRSVKAVVQGVSIALMAPAALLSGFGRVVPVFQCCAQWIALAPGLPGDYLRVAYYWLTLRECSLHSRISFGTFVAQSSVRIARGVYIGAYCIIGACSIGERTQIASQVQILSGAHQHARGADGEIQGSREEDFMPTSVGSDCWIGAGAIVMADIGDGTTIGAGSVVTRPVPSSVVAVGNPARVLEQVLR